jgi:hypothetical protein
LQETLWVQTSSATKVRLCDSRRKQATVLKLTAYLPAASKVRCRSSGLRTGVESMLVAESLLIGMG